MCHFHEEQIRSLQAVCMDGRHEWRWASCCRLFVAAIMIECSKSRVPHSMKKKFAVRKLDMSADRKLSSLCCRGSDWMLRISSSEIILLASIGCELEPNNHLLIVTLTYTDTIA